MVGSAANPSRLEISRLLSFEVATEEKDFDGALVYFDIDNDTLAIKCWMAVMILSDIDNYSSFWQFALSVVQVVVLGAILHQQACFSTFSNYDGGDDDCDDDGNDDDCGDDDDDDF